MIMTQSLDRYGMLTVIKRVENIKGHVMLLCKCDCGTEKVVRKSHLLKGQVVSCGCLKNKICKEFGETRKLENEYQIYEDCAVGTDAKGNSFKVSLEDLEKVKKYYWYYSHGYFITARNGERIIMHSSRKFFQQRNDVYKYQWISGSIFPEGKPEVGGLYKP